MCIRDRGSRGRRTHAQRRPPATHLRGASRTQRTARRHPASSRCTPRRRRAAADRQPDRVGGVAAGLLPHRCVGPAVQRAAACARPGPPARSNHAGGGHRRRTQPRGAGGRQPDLPGAARPDPALYAADDVPSVELSPTDPCLVTFTSGTAGPPSAVLHGQRYLLGRRLQAVHWFAARPGELAWCTAAAGWSKSARNAVIAPWLGGAAALLHDARFDPAERAVVAAKEGVAAWCMAPTEYRIMAKPGVLQRIPSLHSLVAAGEALDPETLRMWREGTGVDVRDGYRQTETGQVTANPYGVPARPGSMGRPLPGVRAFVDAGELIVDPATVPTFFLRYLGQPPPDGLWRTWSPVRQDDDGYLYFDGRTDDVIISAGYRIGPFEVESVLARHPAVADAVVAAAPDAERGSVVGAIVVLQSGRAPATLAPILAQLIRPWFRDQA